MGRAVGTRPPAKTKPADPAPDARTVTVDGAASARAVLGRLP